MRRQVNNYDGIGVSYSCATCEILATIYNLGQTVKTIKNEY